MRTFTPKINSHVTYIDAAHKLKPATVTAVTSNTVVDLRIMHTGVTVAGAVKSTGDGQNSVWRNTDAYQNV